MSITPSFLLNLLLDQGGTRYDRDGYIWCVEFPWSQNLGKKVFCRRGTDGLPHVSATGKAAECVERLIGPSHTQGLYNGTTNYSRWFLS